jgi:DNA-binding NarL/FixJ family response regulator
VATHFDRPSRELPERGGARREYLEASPLPDLAAAVRAVCDQVDLFSEPDLVAALEPYREARLSPGANLLTPRERELLSLLAGGISSTEDLADELYISQKTVKNHLASIYSKLHVSDRAQAAVEAIRLGLDKE